MSEAATPSSAEVTFQKVDTPAARAAAKANRPIPSLSPAQIRAIEAENDAMAGRRAEILDSHINGTYNQRKLKTFSSFYEYEAYDVSDSDEEEEEETSPQDDKFPTGQQPASVHGPSAAVTPTIVHMRSEHTAGAKTKHTIVHMRDGNFADATDVLSAAVNAGPGVGCRDWGSE